MTRVSAEGDERQHRPPAGWVILGLIVVAAGTLYLLTSLLSAHWVPSQWKPDHLRNLGFAVAAIFAVPGAYIVWRRQVTLDTQLAHDKAREQARVVEAADAVERDRRRDYQARFVTAAEMLGNDKPAVRIAGVTAMATLADEWGMTSREQQQACVDVLCDYLRQPHPYDPDTDDPSMVVPNYIEAQVRRTIIRVIAAHLQPEIDGPSRWGSLSFDFSQTDFAYNVDLHGAMFSGTRTDFSGATFSGASTDFSRATFSGTRTNFSGATFSGSRTDFTRATFSGSWTSFVGATFSGTQTAFTHATFAGSRTDFSRATFSDNRRTNFTHATFSGSRTDFSRAAFSDNRRTNFNRATFSSKETDFTEATVADRPAQSRDDALFSGVVFSGVEQSFVLPG